MSASGAERHFLSPVGLLKKAVAEDQSLGSVEVHHMVLMVLRPSDRFPVAAAYCSPG